MYKQALHLEGVTVSVSGRRLFPPLTLSIAPGEVVTLMGPSGSGKSCLLAVICGTADAALCGEGRIRLGPDELTCLPPEQRRIGILFQNDLLFPHLSVGENLAFGLPPGLTKTERNNRITAALQGAGLQGFASRDPATLSGGQKMRVACLRVLLSAPRALLLDEPFSALDVSLRRHFREFLFSRARALGAPVLLVSHDPGDAAAAGGRIIELGNAP